MKENQNDPSDKNLAVDSKELLHNFAIDLFGKLSTDQVGIAAQPKAFDQMSVITLANGEEVGIVREVSEDEGDPDLISLVHRKMNSQTGKVADHRYTINADAIESRAAGAQVDNSDLQLLMNDAALIEFKSTTPRDEMNTNKPMNEARVETTYYALFDAMGESVVDELLTEVTKQPLERWHADWSVQIAA